jgi:hypothetical protein
MQGLCSQGTPEAVASGVDGEDISEDTLAEFVARRRAHIKDVLLVKLRRYVAVSQVAACVPSVPAHLPAASPAVLRDSLSATRGLCRRTHRITNQDHKLLEI